MSDRLEYLKNLKFTEPAHQYEVRVPAERYSGFSVGDKVPHDSPRDAEEVIRVLEKVELRHPPFPVYWKFHNDVSHIRVELTAMVKDRMTGDDRAQGFGFTIPLPVPAGYALFQFEKVLRGLFMYEFEESFHIEGRRWHDPHVHGRTEVHEYDRAGYRR